LGDRRAHAGGQLGDLVGRPILVHALRRVGQRQRLRLVEELGGTLVQCVATALQRLAAARKIFLCGGAERQLAFHDVRRPQLALPRAAVPVALIAVVALFGARGDAVAAHRQRTAVGAGVVIDVVAVVALFGAGDDAVAAAGGLAVVVAAVAVDGVTV